MTQNLWICVQLVSHFRYKMSPACLAKLCDGDLVEFISIFVANFRKGFGNCCDGHFVEIVPSFRHKFWGVMQF